MVGGLELATLVFMDLVAAPAGAVEIKGERYEKMKNYIVDTGYGLERFVWASNGAPTIYDAIFPDLVRQVADLAGVEHNLDDPEYAEIFAQNARLAEWWTGTSTVCLICGEDRRQHRHDPGRWRRPFFPWSGSMRWSTTPCLAYMLGDGIIPSNVKAATSPAGIRRTLRLMKELGLRLPWPTGPASDLSLDYPDGRVFRYHRRSWTRRSRSMPRPWRRACVWSGRRRKVSEEEGACAPLGDDRPL